MAKPIEGYLKLQIQGGAANPSRVGPALGSRGVNIMEFCKQFNARTQDKAGEVIPILMTIYRDKSFDFVIKTPPAPISILKLAQCAKGSSEPNRNKIGTITWEGVEQIARMKMPDLNAFTLSAAMKMIAGTARSMGIVVQGEAP